MNNGGGFSDSNKFPGISLEELSGNPSIAREMDEELLQAMSRMGNADSLDSQMERRYRGAPDTRTVNDLVSKQGQGGGAERRPTQQRQQQQQAPQQQVQEEYAFDYSKVVQQEANSAIATPQKLLESLKKRFRGIPIDECKKLANSIFQDLKQE
jgi:hypothetical protein